MRETVVIAMGIICTGVAMLLRDGIKPEQPPVAVSASPDQSFSALSKKSNASRLPGIGKIQATGRWVCMTQIA